MRTVALLLIAGLPALADWKVNIDKKASPITGQKNAQVQISGKKSIATLVIGCHDTKPFLRIAQNFKITNGINDALTKSRIERAIDKSERYGFSMSVRDGNYVSRIKLRLAAAKEFLDAEVPAASVNGLGVLILDGQLTELLPQMKTDSAMFVQLPYKTGDGIVEFPLDGLAAALAKISEAGCQP